MKMLSFVICTYNGETHLREVIEAIMTQKKLNEYVEQVLVVDNASNDNTAIIVHELMERYPFLKYVYEPTPGLTFARKHSVDVNSKWITYLDDDNILFDENWLEKTVRFINSNPKVGVINCASIASPEKELSEQEQDILYAICPGIACTHESVDSYLNQEQSAIRSPFGAGMTLLREPLIKYLENGWTKSVGRQGNALGSGEDGEIAVAVLNEGYEYAYNADTAIYHIIPESRLSPEYVKKLSRGLDEGYVEYISTKRYSTLLKIGIIVKYSFLNALQPLTNLRCRSSKEKARADITFKSRANIIKLLIKGKEHRDE